MSRSLAGTLTSSDVGLEGLRVEAWDALGICTDLIDVAVTGAHGGFEMQLDVGYLAELLPQKAPQLVFRIFNSGKPIAESQRVVWAATAQATRLRIPVTAAVDTSIAKTVPAQSVVRGVVRHADGTPAAKLIVRALDRGIAGATFADTALGQATTGADGHYEIRYQMPAGGKLKPDLIVRIDTATAVTGTTAVGVTLPKVAATTPPAAESRLVPSAPTAATVSLTLDGAPAALLSEHRTLTASVQTILARSKTAIADLTTAHVAYVAGTSGVQPAQVQMMTQAAQLARDAGGTVDPEIFYGLLRTGHQGDLTALAAVPIDVQRPRLELAIEQNIISATYEPNLDAIVTAMQNAVVSRAMPATGQSAVSVVLGNALSVRDTQTAFVRRWIGRTGSPQEFWNDVRADSTLGAAADDLETTLRLDMLFGGFAPALADLRTQRQKGTVKSMRDLARWQDDDWLKFLSRVGTPAETAGATPAIKAAAYAQTLRPVARAMFPTEYLRGRAAITPPPVATKFVPILAAANPELDLTRPLPDAPKWSTIATADQAAARAEWSAFQGEARTFRRASARTLLTTIAASGGTNPIRAAANRVLVASTIDLEHTTVDQYLAANPKTLDIVDASVRQPVVAYLKSVQRVLRIAGDPAAVESLLADGLDSATRIVRVSRSEFVERYGSLLGGDTAAHGAYSAAFKIATTAQLALTTTAQSMAGASPWAVRGGSSTTFAAPDYSAVFGLLQKTAGASGGTATWPTLFQQEAWCDCDECQSIYGPAAYFVDLLHMLDPDGSNVTPADRLFKRRPDLPNLALTCDNTNTPLPYVDVVNEILELHIAAENDYVDPVTNQAYATSTSFDSTGLTAAELRAVPQNVIAQVYDGALANAVYPFTLPFSRSFAVMRAYLDQLGTSYADVLAAFGPADGDQGLTAAERIAAETLGLTRRQFMLIAGMNVTPAVTLPECYGYAAGNAQWQNTLSAVPELLLRTGIAYDDLVAFVGTYFLNRAGTVTLDPPVQCQIDNTRLHPAADTFDRLHRVVRLWRASGWSVADLDRVLFAVGAQGDHSVTLDRETLRRVGLVKRAVDALDLPLAAVLALWSDLDTWGTDALYLSLFQNRTVARLDDATVFRLAVEPPAKPATGAGELATTNELMLAHVSTILAALRIAAGDLDAIWTHALERHAFGATISTRETTPLNVHALTVVYRYTVLGKGLGLRIADLIAVLELTGADPFVANDPTATVAFTERVAAITSSGCSVATLDYLYRCVSPPGRGPAPADSVVLDALSKIWTALRGVREDTEVVDDPGGTLLATRLALVQPPDAVTHIVDALDPALGLTPAARMQVLENYLRPIVGDAVTAAEQQVTGTPDPDLSDAAALAARKTANQAVVLALVSTALRTSLSEAAVVSVVAGTLGLSDSMARRLSSEWLPGDTGTALDTLLELAAGGVNSQPFDGPGFSNPAAPEMAESISLQSTSSSTPRGVKWSGYLLPLGDGDHTFVLRTDGACTITIGANPPATFTPTLDGTRALLVDHTVGPITLVANTLVKIDVEYDSGSAPGSFALLWKLAASSTPSPVAPEYLFPSLASFVSDASGPGFVWKRAHKASLLILGLGLTEDEIAYAESESAAFNGFHLRDLAMTTPTADATHAGMARWEELAAFVAVRASLPVSDTTLVDVLEARTPIGADPLPWWTQQLSAATGWDSTVMTPLLTGAVADWSVSGTMIVAQLLAGIAGPVVPGAPLTLGVRLAMLQRAIDLVKRVGVPGDAPAGVWPTLRTWAKTEPDAIGAREVVQAVRAGYSDDSQWYQVAQTRNDSLRESQRDALVAYIMPRITIDGAPPADVDSLYEHFLIDVEMGACSQTSRVLQGISTVQLFIQRILLGLEKPISPSRIDPDKWEWNQEYRVWQANRQIFLYPENWIDPELRVDKTPFFATLQSALGQGPLDATNVENAFEAYLLSLDQVSRLAVCALHWEREGTQSDANSALANDKVIDTLHVVARTPGAHPTYFYRTLLGAAQGGGGTEWTPWQKIDVDIQSDGDTGSTHMVLTTYDRRLYLFWALFTEVAEPTQPGASEGDSPPPPLTHWEIRLAWSTYRNGAWSPKQVSPGVVRSPRFITQADLKLYKSALDEVKATIAQDTTRYHKADAAATKAATAFWTQMQALGHQFGQIVAMNATDTGQPSDITTVESIDLHLVGFVFANLDDFEDWLGVVKFTVTQFISDIFRFVDDLPEGFLQSDEDDLDAAYNDVVDLNTKRDDLQATLAKANQALQDFMQGKTALAVPSLTKRTDHTIWLSAHGAATVEVLRHDDRDNPRRLGVFTLSDDGRSVSVSTGTGRVDLSRQTPRHSTPDVNAFRVVTTKHKGLDLEGLPNLLGRVHDATFVDEHWFNHPVTSDSLRPFAISKGTDVEMALPYAPWPAAKPNTSQIERPGVMTSDPLAGILKPVNTTLAKAPVKAPTNTVVNSPKIAASAETQTVLRDGVASTKSALRAQKYFGVDTLGAYRPPAIVARAPYCFEPLHHPYVRSLIKRLERDGVDGLLTTAAQNPSDDDHGEPGAHFATTFKPSPTLVASPYSPHDVDFRPQGPYAPYNWELFFHVPFLIASRLMQDARYEDARTWLHYIFDPTTSSDEDVPARFWKLQPFRDNTDTLNAAQLMTALATDSPASVAASVNAQIDQWNRYPADPHRIARLRLSAYQKAIVFKYIDTLIAWADALFTQDTIETINQATQLYVFASHLLGPRPQKMPPDADRSSFTYADVRGQLDGMSDMVAEVECLLHPSVTSKVSSAPKSEAYALLGISHLLVGWAPTPGTPDVPTVPLAFCVPANAKLLAYFDTIDDRLFKIRHCMNIEGVVQQLPLFQPPIDPALLVRAAAMGLDIGSILSDLSAPLPFHRFVVMLQKAVDLSNELKALGTAVLSALEKQDSETLALLRATHETSLLGAVLEVKKQQVKDAQATKDALLKSRDLAQARHDYYASREFMNPLEVAQVAGSVLGGVMQLLGSSMHLAASASAAAPDADTGPTGMGAHATVKFGGSSIASAAAFMGQALGIEGQAFQTAAGAAGMMGGFSRRQDDWSFQKDLATKELAQIDKQLTGADIKIAIANLDLSNQQLQIDQAAAIERTLRTKYTDTELYSWMITQLSTTYYQAYKLAYELGKRAERCYRFELGTDASSFVRFGYWDSLRKGLLAGEQLALDLKRMDAAYLQADRRDYEITRHVSLVLHDPQALIDLRTQGWCEVDLPEELFDADYPGHYFRRLKSVSLTLPCVVGPYTPINCTLTLLASHVRISAIAGDKYPEQNQPNDARFSHSYGAIQSVATSHGQNDAGLFEVNFRDERYLPFEGAGAVSRWRIDLPKESNAFDVDTLSDVVMKLSYTARDGGHTLAAAARTSLRARWATTDTEDGVTPATPLRRLFRVRYEFSDAWVQFRAALAKGDASLTLTVDRDRFPYLFRGVPITIVSARVFATLTAPVASLAMTITPPQGSAQPLAFVATPDPTIMASGVIQPTQPVDVATGTTDWIVAATAGFPIASVRDLAVVFIYTVKVPH